MLTRRRFLTHSSLAVAGGTLFPARHGLFAASLGDWGLEHSQAQTRIVKLPGRSARPVEAFLNPVTDAETMRRLATGAIDAAVHAGAEWADIRIGDQREYTPEEWTAQLCYGFGLRVRVGGIEAFVGGGDPTPSHLAQAAHSAVATARGIAVAYVRTTPSSELFTPVPAVTGEWRTPIEIDPFAVSIDEHEHVAKSLAGADDVRLDSLRVGRALGLRFTSETRVFASSEGSLTTQYLHNTAVRGNAIGWDSWRLAMLGESVSLPFAGYGYKSCAAGFEIIARMQRFDQLEAASREIIGYGALPKGTVDVGRYTVVLDGVAHAALLQATLVPALSARCALGYDADVGGTSPLSPIGDILGQQCVSPLLSFGVDHGLPSFGAAQWDAEGVTVTGGPLVTQGRVVNYLSSRSTHPVVTAAAQSTSASNGPSIPLMGCVTAMTASMPPIEAPFSVSMPAAPDGGSLADLAKQMGKGLLVRGAYVWVTPDGQGGVIVPYTILEVQRGQIVRRMNTVSLPFGTKKILTTLKVVGGPGTLGETSADRRVGFPGSMICNSATAPAALYSGVDVLDRR